MVERRNRIIKNDAGIVFIELCFSKEVCQGADGLLAFAQDVARMLSPCKFELQLLDRVGITAMRLDLKSKTQSSRSVSLLVNMLTY